MSTTATGLTGKFMASSSPSGRKKPWMDSRSLTGGIEDRSLVCPRPSLSSSPLVEID